MFVFLSATLDTHFIWSFSVSIWFRQEKRGLNIDSYGHQNTKRTKNEKRFKTTKKCGAKTFFTSLSGHLLLLQINSLHNPVACCEGPDHYGCSIRVATFDFSFCICQLCNKEHMMMTMFTVALVMQVHVSFVN